MEKRQLPDGPNARQRIYLIGRLRKAVKWADLFSHLCSVKGDSRTSLEAEVGLQFYCYLYIYNLQPTFLGLKEEKKKHKIVMCVHYFF